MQAPSAAEFLLAETTLTHVHPDLYDVCSCLYHAAKILGRVDAFYVCLYDAPAQALRFVYNREGDSLDTPESFPLGAGPTSWVIRNGRTLVLDGTTRSIHDKGVPFGNGKAKSSSALHLPMPNHNGTATPLGVISVQSTQPNQYCSAHLTAYEWLGLRGAALVSQLEGSSAAKQMHEQFISSQVVIDMLHEIEGRIRSLAVEETSSDHILHEIRRLQTWISWQASRPKQTSSVANLAKPIFSERELQIIDQIAAGNSTGVTALNLCCSDNTVKHYLKSIYRKLGVSSRTQLLRALDDLKHR